MCAILVTTQLNLACCWFQKSVNYKNINGFKRRLQTNTSWAFFADPGLEDSCDAHIHEIRFYSDLECQTALPKNKFIINYPDGKCTKVIDGRIRSSKKTFKSPKDDPFYLGFILGNCSDCVQCVRTSGRWGQSSYCKSYSLKKRPE